MARWSKTSAKFWQDPKVRQWDDREKLLAQYLLTCPHRTTEGLFWLPKPYIATDLGWGIDTVSEVILRLSDGGFVAYDDTTETVIIRKALKYDKPAGVKQITGAVNRLADVPPTPLFTLLRDAAAEFAPDLLAALDEAGMRYPSDTQSKGYPPRARESSSSSYSYSSSSSSSSSSNSSSKPPCDPPAGESPARDDIAEQFEAWWKRWPARDGVKRGKAKALVQWRKLTLDQRRRAWTGAKHYAESGQGPMDAHRFLTRHRPSNSYEFDDWQTPAQPRASPGASHAAMYEAAAAEARRREADQ